MSRTEPTFRLEREVAVRAVKWTDVRMSTDVFPQHARFLAADSTFLTDVFSSSTAPDVHILLVRLVTENISQTANQSTISYQVFAKWGKINVEIYKPSIKDLHSLGFRLGRVSVGLCLINWLSLWFCFSTILSWHRSLLNQNLKQYKKDLLIMHVPNAFKCKTENSMLKLTVKAAPVE